MLSLTGVFSLLLLSPVPSLQPATCNLQIVFKDARTTFLQRLRIHSFVLVIIFSMFEQE